MNYSKQITNSDYDNVQSHDQEESKFNSSCVHTLIHAKLMTKKTFIENSVTTIKNN